MPESSIRLTPRPGGDHRFRPGDDPGETLLVVSEPSGERELGRVSKDGSSIVLSDGRLFRVSVRGVRAPRIEVARWDVPGPYLVARPHGDAWAIERTPAGERLAACDTLELLTTAAIEAWEKR
jgi:hypothetical protein